MTEKLTAMQHARAAAHLFCPWEKNDRGMLSMTLIGIGLVGVIGYASKREALMILGPLSFMMLILEIFLAFRLLEILGFLLLCACTPRMGSVAQEVKKVWQKLANEEFFIAHFRQNRARSREQKEDREWAAAQFTRRLQCQE